MKPLKNYISIILPMITLLLSLQSYMTANRMVSTYQDNLSKDYSIIVVSSAKISKDIVSENLDHIASVELIETTDIMKKFENLISKPNMSLLKTSMPMFYKVQLSKLPSKDDLINIEKELLRLPIISKVETFEKTHNKIFQMFQINKSIITFFAFLLIVISSFLIFKQIQVWQYQHLERIKIMSLFGASMFMKSKSLVMTSIITSILSSLFVIIFFLYLSANSNLQIFLEKLGIKSLEFHVFSDFLMLLSVSLSVSFFILIMILIRQNDEKYD
jgi:cell division transport system permease protein